MKPNHERRKDVVASLGAGLAWAMGGAGLFDAIENVFLLDMIHTRMAGEFVAGDLIPALASVFATAKALLLAAGVLYLLPAHSFV
jgi:hypothetical protein